MEKGSITVNQKSYSLLEVLQSIQSVLKNAYDDKLFWVRCELSRINLNASSGHAYLELIERSETGILAQLRGIIWSDKYRVVCEKFLSVTKTSLSSGIKVMLQCSVSFHPVHGLSLFISDIEPVFTLGEMARLKNEALARLKTEKLFDRNRQRNLVLLPGRIAIISVDTSRGYQDFISTLDNYPRKFRINCHLFEAVLQGENAVPSLIRALKIIESKKEHFDAIVIVRGGAGDSGLACYDEYDLASVVANSSLPVITGIGHATNETVVEMISFKNCITPTAAATFLLDKFEAQNYLLEDSCIVLRKSVRNFIQEENKSIKSHFEVFSLWINRRLNEQALMLSNLHNTIPSFTNNYIQRTKQYLVQSLQTVLNAKKLNNHLLNLSKLNQMTVNLHEKTSDLLSVYRESIVNEKEKLSQLKIHLEKKKETLMHASEKVKILDPVNILKRGYSITRHKGTVLTDATDVESGVELVTTLANGVLYSTVEKK